MKIAVFSPKFSELGTFNSQKFLILKSQYDQLGHEVSYFDYPDFSCEEILQELVSKMTSSGFDKIAFMPFKDSSFVFVREFISRLKLSVSIVFHLDGNFIFHSLKWSKLEPTLKDRTIELVCSSESQRKLIQRFLPSNYTVELLSPSLSAKPILYDAKTIEELRSKYCVSEDDVIFICTGSMERQKYILELSKVFFKLSEQLNIKAHLWLVGEFNDTGIPLAGRSQLPFEYYQQWTNLESVFGENLKLRFFDSPTDQNLDLYYQCSDFYLNLSTIDNDDFNYDVLEAYRNGLDLILSSWGSHLDFNVVDSTKQVPLNLDAPFLHPNMNAFAKLFITSSLHSKRLSKDRRLERIGKSLEHFSIDKSLKQLASILASRKVFPGFNDELDKVCDSFEKNPYAPFVDIASLGAYNQTYKNIYASYF